MLACCRCGGGPLLGGILTDAIGFAWTATIFGAVIAAQAIAVAFLVISMRRRTSGGGDELQESESDALLSERPTGRRLSFSHDAPRAMRGGLAAPSWDVTSQDIRGVMSQNSE